MEHMVLAAQSYCNLCRLVLELRVIYESAQCPEWPPGDPANQERPVFSAVRASDQVSMSQI
jgi:hypothetical protein